MNDLPALLADRGIRLKSIRPGSTTHTLCPKCGGGKTREQSLSVTVDEDGNGIVMVCHRGTCGWRDGARVNDGLYKAQKQHDRSYVAPPVHAPALTTNRPPSLYAFFEKRGISAETVDAFGLYVAKHWFPAHAGHPAGEMPAIVFPYTVGCEVVGRKYRSQYKAFGAEKDSLPTLYNIDSVGTPDVVVFCEGECDVLALYEAGYPQTVSLRDGAPAELRDENDPRREEDKRFLPLRTHSDLLGKVQKFILAGDMDDPGTYLREELARRLGRHRCWVVRWPADCKDACDTLAKHGAAEVARCIEAAEPYPIGGIQRLRAHTLLELRNQPPPPLLTTGLPELDDVVKWPGEGRLIIVTGIPSHGKTSLTRYAMLSIMRRHKDRKFQVFSPEMQPWEQFAAMCAEVLVGKPFYRGQGVPQMSDREVLAATDWMRNRLLFLASDAEDDPPTLDWLIDRTRISIIRDGVTDLLIDPWNEIEHSRGNLSETEYIGRSLQKIKAFALRHGCNIWIVVHPAKMQPPKPGAEIEPPGMYDISGSSHWANKADLGITVHTPDGSPTQVLVKKARFSRFGQRGNKVELSYDVACGRYFSPYEACPRVSWLDDTASDERDAA